MKQQGAVAILCYGTPIAVGAERPDHQRQDPLPHARLRHRPGQRPVRSTRTSSRWRRATTRRRRRPLDYVAHRGQGQEGRRSPTCYYDNPAGKEPLPGLEQLADERASSCKTFAVPAPGLEHGAQVTDIVSALQGRLRDHPPLRSGAVGVDQGVQGGRVPARPGDLARVGRGRGRHRGRRRLRRSPRATRRCSSPASARTSRSIKEIVAMYEARKEAARTALTKYSVYYNRGVFMAAVMLGRHPQGARGGRRRPSPARRSRRVSSRSRTSSSAGSPRRCRPARPIMRVAASPGSTRSRTGSSRRSATGTTPSTTSCWTWWRSGHKPR